MSRTERGWVVTGYSTGQDGRKEFRTYWTGSDWSWSYARAKVFTSKLEARQITDKYLSAVVRDKANVEAELVADELTTDEQRS